MDNLYDWHNHLDIISSEMSFTSHTMVWESANYFVTFFIVKDLAFFETAYGQIMYFDYDWD